MGHNTYSCAATLVARQSMFISANTTLAEPFNATVQCLYHDTLNLCSKIDDTASLHHFISQLIITEVGPPRSQTIIVLFTIVTVYDETADFSLSSHVKALSN